MSDQTSQAAPENKYASRRSAKRPLIVIGGLVLALAAAAITVGVTYHRSSASTSSGAVPGSELQILPLGGTVT
jgi:hypothetical protein